MARRRNPVTEKISFSCFSLAEKTAFVKLLSTGGFLFVVFFLVGFLFFFFFTNTSLGLCLCKAPIYFAASSQGGKVSEGEGRVDPG